MTTPKGTLVAVGGGEDKERDLHILETVLRSFEGEPRRVEIIAAASREPREASRPYLRAFERLGVRRVDALDLQSRRAAEERRTEERLAEADILYFTGGDQARLVETLAGTKALEIIRERYEEGAVLAGTSAGAAAMSSTMITSGLPEEGLNKGNVETAKGFALLANCVIDTHFIQRGRFSRLLEVITRNPSLLGLGIAEDTALFVRRGREADVVGSDNVLIIDGNEIQHTSVKETREGDPLAVERAIVHALAHGYFFDLEERTFVAARENGARKEKEAAA